MVDDNTRSPDGDEGLEGKTTRDRIFRATWSIFAAGPSSSCWLFWSPRMEQRLSTELKADRHRGYRVALVNWPNPSTRTLGLLVADFSEPESGRELAAVYLPGAPDPTKGSMRVVPADDLTMTDWDLSDLTKFHITFGSASPDLSDIEE